MITYTLLKIFFCIFLLVLSGTSAKPKCRIVGGSETTIEKRPYQASLLYDIDGIQSHVCGAVIISRRFLLTAARCDPGFNLYNFYARVGSTMYYRDGQLIKIETFIPHSQYNKNTFDFNFAIVVLRESEPIVLGENAAIAKLASTEDKDPEDGSMVTVSGWGITSEDASETPFNLREVDLPVFNREDCKIHFDYLTDRQMCLGGIPEGCASPCTFDTGGPAVHDGILYGIISNGKSCDLPNVPGVYGRVSSIRQWIKDYTGV